jgi:release factor glutamine methyltransferase
VADAAAPVAGDVAAGALVRELAAVLAAGGIADAGREARDLVAALVDEPRFWPTVNAGAPLSPGTAGAARDAAARRGRGEPFAYCVGRAAFRHLTLLVDQRVLIPRQETERLVDLVLARTAGGRGTLVDIGTGSGAIVLALCTEGSFARAIATDLSADALDVARANAGRYAPWLRADLSFAEGAGVAPAAGERIDVIVSNPPYISYGEAAALPACVRDWEPPMALVAADDGLAVTAAIVRDAPPVLVPGGLLALEVDERRAVRVAALVRDDGRYRGVEIAQDLTGRDRFVLATRL